MLHSGKARANHDSTQQRLKTKSSQQFATQRASDLLKSGAPLSHVNHMINKGYVTNDLN